MRLFLFIACIIGCTFVGWKYYPQLFKYMTGKEAVLKEHVTAPASLEAGATKESPEGSTPAENASSSTPATAPEPTPAP